MNFKMFVFLWVIFLSVGKIHGDLSGYLTSAYRTVKVYIDGERVPLDNDNIWNKPGKVNLGNPTPGSCVTLGVKFDNRQKKAGWVKAVFNNGDETDSSWKCTNGRSDVWTRKWAEPDFDDSLWAPAMVNADNGESWDWDPSATDEFIQATVISYPRPLGITFESDGVRQGSFCRTKICNKCRVDECFDCEDKNPCSPLAKEPFYLYPHYNPEKYIECSGTGSCSVMDRPGIQAVAASSDAAALQPQAASEGSASSSWKVSLSSNMHGGKRFGSRGISIEQCQQKCEDLIATPHRRKGPCKGYSFNALYQTCFLHFASSICASPTKEDLVYFVAKASDVNC